MRFWITLTLVMLAGCASAPQKPGAPAFDAVTWDKFLRHIQEFAFADAQALLDDGLARLAEP